MARAESKASTSEVSFQEDIERSAKHLSNHTEMMMQKGLPSTLNPTMHCVTAKDGEGDGEDVGLGLQREAMQQGAKNRAKSKQLRRLCLMVLGVCGGSLFLTLSCCTLL